MTQEQQSIAPQGNGAPAQVLAPVTEEQASLAPYQTPRLTTHGRFEQLTLQMSGPGMGMGGGGGGTQDPL